MLHGPHDAAHDRLAHADAVHPDEKERGEQKVRERARRRDDRLLPPRTGEEIARLGHRIRLLGVVTGHLHVAAEEDHRDPVLGLAAPESDQLPAKADGEALHTDPEPFGGGEVAEFVNEHEHAENEKSDQNGRQHEISLCGTATRPVNPPVRDRARWIGIDPILVSGASTCKAARCLAAGRPWLLRRASQTRAAC